MHNVIRIMVMIAAVCLFFRLQKCSVDGKEHSDNSEEFFRYLKMRQRTAHDRSSQKPFQRYLEDQLFKSNHYHDAFPSSDNDSLNVSPAASVAMLFLQAVRILRDPKLFKEFPSSSFKVFIGCYPSLKLFKDLASLGSL